MLRTTCAFSGDTRRPEEDALVRLRIVIMIWGRHQKFAKFGEDFTTLVLGDIRAVEHVTSVFILPITVAFTFNLQISEDNVTQQFLASIHFPQNACRRSRP